MLDMRGFLGGAGESFEDPGAANEEILLYPHPNLRIRHKTGDPVDGVASYLHTDQLGSVRVMTGADGASDKEVTYRLRCEESISALCRREGIAESLYYIWSKEFLEAGKRRLSDDTTRQATSPEVKELLQNLWP